MAADFDVIVVGARCAGASLATLLAGRWSASSSPRSRPAPAFGRSSRGNPRLLPGQVKRLYEISRRWPTKRAVLELYRATPPSALAGLKDQYRALDVPAQVVWGVTDAYIPWQQAERQRESFPSARIELLDGLGHWSFQEDPARVAEAVMPFLLEQAAEGSELGEPEPACGPAGREPD